MTTSTSVSNTGTDQGTSQPINNPWNASNEQVALRLAHYKQRLETTPLNGLPSADQKELDRLVEFTTIATAPIGSRFDHFTPQTAAVVFEYFNGLDTKGKLDGVSSAKAQQLTGDATISLINLRRQKAY
ncbi:MAG: hypothetical protein EYC62_01820 [Alphaproteobacteria bacterium]|nr:MAG: hypothetical protein EYC62_01820 [Alphaproteobacteria bacterium]